MTMGNVQHKEIKRYCKVCGKDLTGISLTRKFNNKGKGNRMGWDVCSRKCVNKHGRKKDVK